MLRRNQRTGELAFYRCWMPRPTPLATLVSVAGTRWTVEERFQTGKGLCGLDQHQVRRWRSWYRWATLAMLAHAFLVVAALLEHTQRPPPPGFGLIPLTCNEVQHLFAALTARPAGDRDPGHRLRWSIWRRRHQARARTCHYRRQAAWPPSFPHRVKLAQTCRSGNPRLLTGPTALAALQSFAVVGECGGSLFQL
jgi:hypothetical protein